MRVLTSHNKKKYKDCFFLCAVMVSFSRFGCQFKDYFQERVTSTSGNLQKKWEVITKVGNCSGVSCNFGCLDGIQELKSSEGIDFQP